MWLYYCAGVDSGLRVGSDDARCAHKERGLSDPLTMPVDVMWSKTLPILKLDSVREILETAFHEASIALGNMFLCRGIARVNGL